MKKEQWSKTRFKEEFKRGLGSSFLALQQAEDRDLYKDIILWACLHNTCYDMQSEGVRSGFLYQAIMLYEDKAFFEIKIIYTFMNNHTDSWLFDQLGKLVYYFAVDGSEQARQVMYKKYHLLLEASCQYSGSFHVDDLQVLCIWLISLDGFKAFREIAAQLGEIIHSQQVVLELSWFYEYAQSKFGKKRVITYVENKAEQQDEMRAFLTTVSCSYSSSESTDVKVPITLQDVLKAARAGSARGVSLRFAIIASEADLFALANHAVQETDLRIQLELLWAFRKVPFPLHSNWIFQLAENEQTDLREIAFQMMKHLPAEQIREYTLHLLHQQKEVANALELLCTCYRLGDEPLLYEAIKRLPISYSTGKWHSVFMRVEELLTDRSNQMTSQIFMYMYRTTLCSYCRYDLVRNMYKQNMLTDQVLEQCLYDSYEDTRIFAERKLRKSRKI